MTRTYYSSGISKGKLSGLFGDLASCFRFINSPSSEQIRCLDTAKAIPVEHVSLTVQTSVQPSVILSCTTCRCLCFCRNPSSSSIKGPLPALHCHQLVDLSAKSPFISFDGLAQAGPVVSMLPASTNRCCQAYLSCSFQPFTHLVNAAAVVSGCSWLAHATCH
jgi:hypothetical protein